MQDKSETQPTIEEIKKVIAETFFNDNPLGRTNSADELKSTSVFVTNTEEQKEKLKELQSLMSIPLKEEEVMFMPKYYPKEELLKLISYYKAGGEKFVDVVAHLETANFKLLNIK